MICGPKNGWKGMEHHYFFKVQNVYAEKIKEIVKNDVVVKVFKIWSHLLYDRELQFYGRLYDVYFLKQQLRVRVYDSSWIYLPAYGLFGHQAGVGLASERLLEEERPDGIFNGRDRVYFDDKKGHILEIWADGKIFPHGQGWFHFEGAFGCVNKKHLKHIKECQEAYFTNAKKLFYLCVFLGNLED